MKEGEVEVFVELHIEQGPLLEAEGTQLGVVTAIAAPAALRVFFSGDGGHAGALLMPARYRHLSTWHTSLTVCAVTSLRRACQNMSAPPAPSPSSPP